MFALNGKKAGVNTGAASPRRAFWLLWRNERGMALLITLMVLSLLIVITIGYHKTTWRKFIASHNLKVTNQLRVIADSAVQLGMAFLQYDGSVGTTTSFFSPWAIIKDEDFRDLFAVGTGTLHLEIIDLSGRLQINSLVGKDNQEGRRMAKESRAILSRLLLTGSFAVKDESQVQELVDALVDWLDNDDRESDHGAENSYYRSLDPSYGCKNGPVEYMEELLLVKGMTPELLFGTPTKVGLAEYVTVYGHDGKININTAPRLLLGSLDPLMNEELTDRMDGYRKDARNAARLGDPAWYKKIGGWPGDIVIYENVLTTESNFFQINGAGRMEKLEKRMTAVVERGGRGQVTLLWRKVE